MFPLSQLSFETGELMDKITDKYIGTILDDRYEILQLIGTGGMANVYKALCHRLNRYDAIKIMHDDTAANEDLRKRFRTESQAVAMLSHPNIVSVYDVSHNAEIEYIVMELVNGITLKEHMKQQGRLTPDEVVNFSSQIAKALAHAHERGIIHRDIKPQNIMLLKDGLIKVADFGIASLQNETEIPTEEALGSVHYIAPEQARGYQSDARSDIYSLGIVMYEMLTGHLPYNGETAVEIAVKHMNALPTMPRDIAPDIPSELERITLKAMNPSINERYQTAQELLSDLEAYNKSYIAASATASETDYALSEADSDKDAEPEHEDEATFKKRSGKAAFITGGIGIFALVIVLLLILNGKFLNGLFGGGTEIEVNDFVGRYYEDVINDSDNSAIYDFTVVYQPDEERDYGIIISQSPEAGTVKYTSENKVKIKLVVSSGQMIPGDGEVQIPEIESGKITATEAERIMSAAGLNVKIQEINSDVTEGYVVKISPEAGEIVKNGSTVKIYVSIGPAVKMVKVPNLVGLSRDKAIERLEAEGLSIGSIDGVESEQDEGFVIWQSVNPGGEVELRTRIDIQVSIGSGGED